MMHALKITLLRDNYDPNESMSIAINVLAQSNVVADVDKTEGVLRDDDGLLAVWEWIEA